MTEDLADLIERHIADLEKASGVFTAQDGIRILRLLKQELAKMPTRETVEAVADAIDAARFASPKHPRERPRPFAEADKTDREYSLRLARAAIAALSRPQAGELSKGKSP